MSVTKNFNINEKFNFNRIKQYLKSTKDTILNGE